MAAVGQQAVEGVSAPDNAQLVVVGNSAAIAVLEQHMAHLWDPQEEEEEEHSNPRHHIHLFFFSSF